MSELYEMHLIYQHNMLFIQQMTVDLQNKLTVQVCKRVNYNVTDKSAGDRIFALYFETLYTQC